MSTPKAGVKVIITNTLTKEQFNVLTDANGLATFTAIPVGEYTVDIVKPSGFEFSPGDSENQIIDGITANNNVVSLPYLGVDLIANQTANGTIVLKPTQSGITENIPTLSTTYPMTVITATGFTSGGVITDRGNCPILQRGFCYVDDGTVPDINDPKVVIATELDSFIGATTLALLSSTTYKVRAYATNKIGTGYGPMIFGTTLASISIVLPTVVTSAASAITKNGFTIGGNVSARGDSDVIGRGICYSLASSPTINDTKVAQTVGGLGVYSSNLVTLAPNTTYHVRAYAVNSAGVAYGNEVVVATERSIVIPSVVTKAVSGKDTLATSGGIVTNPTSEIIQFAGICWCAVADGTPTISLATRTADSGADFNSALVGLVVGTTYNVKAYIIYNGTTIYDTGMQQYTAVASTTLPVCTMASIDTSPLGTTVNLNGVIVHDGGASVTERGFVYSRTNNPPTIGDTKISLATGLGAITSPLTLTVGDSLYVRSYAVNVNGVGYSTYVASTVIYNNTGLPDVTLAGVGGTGETSKEFQATVAMGTNDLAITHHGFYYVAGNSSVNPKTSPYKKSIEVGLTLAGATFNKVITDFQPGTTYQVMAYVRSAAGEANSGALEFTTAIGTIIPTEVPLVVTLDSTNKTTTSADIHGQITNNRNAAIQEAGFIIVSGIVTNVISAPGSHYSVQQITPQGGTFHDAVPSIPGGSFTYIAYATNLKGTGYGLPVSVSLPQPQVGLATISILDNIAIPIVGDVAIAYNITDNAAARALTDYGIVYSTDPNNPPTLLNASVSAGKAWSGAVGSVSPGLLEPITDYYVRGYITNPAGTSYSLVTRKITSALAAPVGLPEVQTGLGYGLSSTSVRIEGAVDWPGASAVTEDGFYYVKATSATFADMLNGFKVLASAVVQDGTFVKTLTGLVTNGNYLFMAYALNDQGTAYGSISPFTVNAVTALPSPTINTVAVTSIGKTTVTSGGDTILATGWTIVETGLCWATLINPTIADTKEELGTTAAPFSYAITGLSAETTYHVRAYITVVENGSNVTYYGNDRAFTTEALYIIGDTYSGGIVYAWDGSDVSTLFVGSTMGYDQALVEVAAKAGWSICDEGHYATIAGLINATPALAVTFGMALDTDYWSSTEFDVDDQNYLNFTDGNGHKAKVAYSDLLLTRTTTI